MFKKNSGHNLNNLIESYRIISLILTLSIYLINGSLSQYNIFAMLLLAFCIIVSAALLLYLYRLSWQQKTRLFVLLFMEIIGISLLMLATGGLRSPFIWYFLNPLLIISYYLQTKEKVFYLTVNLLLLFFIDYYQERTVSVAAYFLNHSNIILSYLLILILINMLFGYYKLLNTKQKELREAKEKLEHSNIKIKALIEDLLLTYEAVQSLSSGPRGQDKLLEILLDFTGKIAPKAHALFFLKNDSQQPFIQSLRPFSTEIRLKMLKYISENYDAIAWDAVSMHQLTAKEKLLLVKVANIKDYGILGLLFSKDEQNEKQEERTLSLLFFARLAAILLEKEELEALNHELAIAEEQNRIADDIHDSVVQRLFAASCLIYETIKQWEQIDEREKKEQIMLVMNTIQSSLQDLRSTIYNLSSKKQQVDLFKENLTAYLKDLERLSGVQIHLELAEVDFLDRSVKKALYRIILESVGNAIRHGGSNQIRVKLHLTEDELILTIQDDGCGFDWQKAAAAKDGLGLSNIRTLSRILNGTLTINSTPDSGTTIELVFANPDITKKLT
ncbi:MAG: sensor histidine kinase [Firmicutes bacterium]|nr:sensor histidine kinase [Bacillota bacterium]